MLRGHVWAACRGTVMDNPASCSDAVGGRLVRWERDAVTGLSSLLRSIVIEVTIGFLAVVLFGYARMRVLTGLIYGSVLLFLINGMFLTGESHMKKALRRDGEKDSTRWRLIRRNGRHGQDRGCFRGT